MSDVHSPEQRSFNMSRIRSRDTKPEMIVRSLVHQMGYRFRLHKKGLPGTPDLVLTAHRKVIFVHGCFWHGCPNCKLHTPRSNSAFWAKKVTTNKARDQHKVQALRKMGWRVYTIWECGLRKSPQRTLARVLNELGST